MDRQLFDPEFMGVLAGAINIASTWPQLASAFGSAQPSKSIIRRGLCAAGRLFERAVQFVPPGHASPEFRGRIIQLVANLLWFTYAWVHNLPVMQYTTGVMCACLVALAWRLYPSRPARLP